MKKIQYLTFLIFITLAFIGVNNVYAESEEPSKMEKQILHFYKNASMPDDGFQKPVLENLMELFWLTNFWKIDDNDHIDNYLMVNECQIYTDYYYNEFEWDKIRELTREKLKKDVWSFSNKFEVVTEINLGRYNVEGEYFEITEDTRLEDVQNIETAENYRQTICNRSNIIKTFPQNMVASLTQPISLVRLPVFNELAALYIADMKERNKLIPESVRMSRRSRPAFVRLRVEIVAFMGLEGKNTQFTVPVMLANVDSIEVYGDKAMKKPLYVHKVNRRSR